MDQQLRLMSGPVVLVALLPALHVLLPVGWPGRKLALLALFAVLGYRPAETPRGCLDYFVLDVGQGLSVFVRTSDHALLFDTGPMFATGNSAAEFVVLPFLHGLGVTRLDRLIVSHADIDHAGGIQPVLAALPVRQVMTGEDIADISARQTRCVAGISWRGDSAVYSILHPRLGAPWTRNNSSCVLEITIGAHRLLLSGDIEAPVEKLLVYRQSIGPGRAASRQSNILDIAACPGGTAPDCHRRGRVWQSLGIPQSRHSLPLGNNRRDCAQYSYLRIGQSAPLHGCSAWGRPSRTS
jgi:competence protein ComEC